MPRLLVILLVSWAYVGCASRTTPVVAAAPEFRQGGVVRVALQSRRVAEAVGTWAVSRPLVATEAAGGPAISRGHDPEADGSCHSFRFVPPARYPDGTAILPQDLIVDLHERLRDPDSAARWLLSPVEGAAEFADGRRDRVDGLVAEGASLLVCTSDPARDLLRRFEHPELQHRRRDPDQRLTGPGPFMETRSGSLVANPDHAGAPPHLERIERIVAADAALLMEVGEADLALLYGEPADRLLAAGLPALRVERSPAWDRRFALWLNPQARWLNDPRFRRWVAGVMDRPGMVEYLFAGRGDAVWDLIDDFGAPAPVEVVEARPVSPKSVPRFALSFDASDRDSEKIAARIKATLRTSRVEVTLLPTPAEELRRRLREGRVQAAVLPAEPFFEDPLLALLETSAGLGPSAEDAILVLDQGARLDGPEDRRRAASAAHDILIQDAMVIPLLRLHAWLARRSDLGGVRAGPRRVLQLHEAGWLR